MLVAMFWDSEGVILTHCVPKSTTVTGETYEDVLRTKFLPALREKWPKKTAAVPLITTLLLIGRLVFTSFSMTTTLKLFLMLRTHLTSNQAIFGCFQHWRTLFVVAHFQVVLHLQQWFSSSHNEPLESICCGHAIAASALWKMCTSTGWLRWEMTAFSAPRISIFF